MKEIIAIGMTEIDGSEVNSVNSRDIYEYLNVGDKYPTWFNRAVEKYDFTEGEDFIAILRQTNGRPSKDYIVTLDMAKELCMVSNTEKGKETRKYFIAAEKRASRPQTRLEILDMARDSELKRLETQAKLETQKMVNGMLVEKIDRKDNIILAVARLNIQVGDILLQEFAKNLNIKNLGRTNIFAWFKERGYLMKNTEPYSQYMKRGFFTRKPTEEKFGGKIRYTTMITPKGQTYFTQILRAEFEPEITPEEI